jgi:hypothetical protein
MGGFIYFGDRAERHFSSISVARRGFHLRSANLFMHRVYRLALPRDGCIMQIRFAPCMSYYSLILCQEALLSLMYRHNRRFGSSGDLTWLRLVGAPEL